jgi:mannose-6-phosphate isomerase-like protein (cupin superfamily)
MLWFRGVLEWVGGRVILAEADLVTASSRPPELHGVEGLAAFHISPGDTVKLAVLRHPDDLYDTSVIFEVWEPGGAQPPNSHPASVETFFFISGSGVAYCDGHIEPVRAGQLLVLPPQSLHRIENSGTDRLYAITTMAPDAGFAALIEAGEPTMLSAADLAVARGVPA